jgi:hypothetical protein
MPGARAIESLPESGDSVKDVWTSNAIDIALNSAVHNLNIGSGRQPFCSSFVPLSIRPRGAAG